MILQKIAQIFFLSLLLSFHPTYGIEKGDTAPDFELMGSDGKTHRLADYKGQTVVLAWFPKAFTGG